MFGVLFIACKQKSDGNGVSGSETSAMEKNQQSTITFPAPDGLSITADIAMVDTSAPTIILCHQAGWSRGEYKEIAPKLNEMGYNTLAIDQRSGGEINGVVNETARRAEKKGLATGYLDARQDIEAALNYVEDSLKTDAYLWGSSYSAGLVLMIANDNPRVLKVLSFSPGEYYGSNDYLSSRVNSLNIPVFITSAKGEVQDIVPIYTAIPSGDKVFFGPKGEGEHGSRNLWDDKPDHAEYWDAVKTFLGSWGIPK